MATSAFPRRTRRQTRRRIQPVGVLAAALLLAGGSYLARAAGDVRVTEPPAAPGAHGAVVEPVAAGAPGPGTLTGAPAQLGVEELDSRIATWSAMAAADPNDYLSATNLGVLYLGRARLSGDLSDYDRAAAATARALAADPAYGPARALDATVRFATHDFRGALAAATALLADEAGHADALAVLGDASLELGRIDQARRTYASLGSIAPGPALEVRLARLAFVTGDPARALAIARGARNEARATGEADMAFYEYQLGEFARLAGDASTAEEAFRAALGARPAHIATLVGLARVDAAAGRSDHAAAALERAVAIAPQPEALALLGDIRALRGDAAAADDLYATVRLTATLSELAGSVYDRQLIGFELDHGGATDELLGAARRSLADRPDAAGHDLVAWALHRLGRDDMAAAEIDRALATGIADARIEFHAGAIAIRRGAVTAGRDLLASALAKGPALDPLERAEAQRLLDATGG